MKRTIIFLLLVSCVTAFGFPCQSTKTKQADIILAKVKALPEIKEWLSKQVQNEKKDLILEEPGKTSKLYSIQVGAYIKSLEKFRTNYYLYIDPKTYQIYYWDSSDIANSKITLQQWRYWRNKPGFHQMHHYKDGKLIIEKP